MKQLFLFALLLLTLRPASAQLPAPVEYPGDVQLIPRAGAPFLRWSSTGPAYWNVERSTDLQTWTLQQSTRETSAAGALVERGLTGTDLPSVVYFRLTHLKDLPVITREPVDVTIHAQAGESFSLNAGANGAPPLLLRWYWNSTLIATFTNQNYSLLERQTLGGNYQMVAANPWGAVTSRVAVVTAIPPPPPPPPSIVSGPVDVTRLEGQTFPMAATVSGFNPLINRWYRDGSLIGSSTNDLHPTLTNLTLGGAYQLIVSNVGGMATSRVAIATIKPSPDFAPASIAGRLLEIKLEEGIFNARASFYRVRIAGSGDGYALEGIINQSDAVGTYVYQRKDGVSAQLSLKRTWTSHTAPAELDFLSPTNGHITLHVSQSSIDYGDFTLTVEPTHIPPRILIEPQDATVYAGRSFSFGVYAEGDFPIVHRWYRDGLLVDSLTDVSRQFALTNQTLAGAYQLISSNAWGMVTSRVAIATVKPVPDYAPATLAAHLLDLHGNSAVFKFGTRILLRTAYADSTYTVRDYYDPQQPSQGVYTYERVDGVSAVATFEDEHAGTVTVQFEFSSSNGGTFTHSIAGTSARVSGDFSFTH